MAKKREKIDFYSVHQDMMKNDPGYKEKYDELEGEYLLISQMLKVTLDKGISQREIAKKMKTSETAISRMLKGSQSPSWATIEKFAKALGMKAKINFVPA